MEELEVPHVDQTYGADFSDSQISELLEEVIGTCQKETLRPFKVEVKNIGKLVSGLKHKEQVQAMLHCILRTLSLAAPEGSRLVVTVHNVVRKEDYQFLTTKGLTNRYFGVSIRSQTSVAAKPKDDEREMFVFLDSFFSEFGRHFENGTSSSNESAKEYAACKDEVNDTYLNHLRAIVDGANLDGVGVRGLKKEKLTITIYVPEEHLSHMVH